MLSNHAKNSPDAIALLAPDRQPVTYGALFDAIIRINQYLTSKGISSGDRIALVMPNGLDMAITFLGILSTSAVAPLNPAYKYDEFDFYLSDTRAATLVADLSADSPAIEVAKRKNIELLDQSESFDRNINPAPGTHQHLPDLLDRMPRGEDVAIILHTSGTTSRPKSVPLTHTNLAVSAVNISRSINLDAEDRCLNIMPLFHVHGMIGALFSSLSVGASTICSPGFEPLNFFAWMKKFRPTWFSAVPTMHQILITRSKSHQNLLKSSNLRFIRSCSAALSPQAKQDIEDKFYVPVIEAYGMTEASHQITSNPFPPHKRKPGSVGLPTGTKVAIMNHEGIILESGDTGEIVICGANVTSGYENNVNANSNSFIRGWFRTGDQGYIDSDGYLIISGRIKEIINRGGEKISPREIDEVLLRHPYVVQAVAFPVPHPKLGEDIAAVVVLSERMTIDEQEIKQHVARHLAKFKVPRNIYIVDEIPKGPTGKIQRVTLSEKLNLGLT